MLVFKDKVMEGMSPVLVFRSKVMEQIYLALVHFVCFTVFLLFHKGKNEALRISRIWVASHYEHADR